MLLIVLYGPPAVGKLTVARELRRQTSFALLHNHLTEDPFRAVIPLPMDNPLFRNPVNSFRIRLVELAVKHNVPGLIYTLVYVKDPKEDRYIRRLARTVEKHNGKIVFVQLHCPRAELFKRVRHPSRKLFAKIHKIAVLKRFMNEKDLHAGIPFVNSYVIDNTHLSAKQCAQRIVKHFKIPRMHK